MEQTSKPDYSALPRYIAEVRDILGCTPELAERVRGAMDCTGIDYSECTQREFIACARNCFAELRVTEADMAHALKALDAPESVLVDPPKRVRAKGRK
jgi:hypothetical protein